MKRNILFSFLVSIMLLSFTTSCGKDEVEQKTEQGGNQSGQGGQSGSDDDQGGSAAPIIVTVDANGNADGGHRFVKIDDTNFYIDDIKYTATKGDLLVTGYNDAFFKGEAKIISQLNYEGHEMHVTGIGEKAFANCKVLTSVTIPSSVTSIEGSTFSGCTGLTTVTIPSSVTSIGGYAFYGCTGLTSVIIPSSITSIGQEAFYRCTNLTSVTINSNSIVSKNYYNEPNLSSFFDTQVQSYILGDGVTSIGIYAFRGCTGLTSVTIQSTVSSIGERAFSGCAGLTSISVAEGNPKYDSRGNCNAMIETESNTLILGCKGTTIPSSVTSIGKGAFSDCTGLTDVVIPSSITSIGRHAFYGCTGLASVTIPSSVTSIGDGAFSDCTKLNSMTIPSSVTYIGQYVFEGCTGLTSVTIPSSVTSIGFETFQNCTGLTTVTLPEGITYIGQYAFSYCKVLSDVYCNAETLPNTISDAFYDSPIANATLHVPASAIDAYRTTAPWSGFGTIVAIQ